MPGAKAGHVVMKRTSETRHTIRNGDIQMSETFYATPSTTPAMGLVQYDHGNETVKWYNNTGADIPVGQPVVQGDLWGVCGRPIPNGTTGELTISGCFWGPKSANDSGLTPGAPAYWDSVNVIFTSNGEGTTAVGKVEKGPNPLGAVLPGDVTVYVIVLAAAIAPGSGPDILAGQTSQGVFATSATQNYQLGAILDLPDGRRFRYAQAAATNITRALMQQSAALNTYFSDIVQTGHAQVVGATAITTLCTTGSANPANYFAGGRLIVTTGTNIGDSYPILSSALQTTDTLMNLVLGEPLRHPIAVTDKVTLIPNRWAATIVVPVTTPTGAPAGVPAVDVTASYFYWAQTKGPAAMIVDTGDTLVVGGKGGIPSTDAIAGTVGTSTATGYAFPFYGTVMSIGSAGEAALINLELE